MKESAQELALLTSGLQQLNITTNPAPLLDFLHLLQKWNRTYNLTSIRDISGMINKHLLDSLAISPWLKGDRFIDVGCGAGFPGIPLAMAFPEKHFTLLDSNGKKTRFIQEAKRALQLKNIEVIESRAEDYQPPHTFDTVMCRALTEIQQLIQWTEHLISPEGQWLAMKGHRPDLELQDIHHPYSLHYYQVPGVHGERCCVIITH